MKVYKTKSKKFSGTDFCEVHKKAFGLYADLKKKTRRRAYIRSAYFNKEKIFIDLFWNHLFEKKNWRDRVRRMKYFGCAVELIQNSRLEAQIKKDPNKSSESFYRFYGITIDNDLFCVQIKENRKKNKNF